MVTISLRTAFDLFIFDRETYCSPKTVSNYRHSLSYFFDFMEGKYKCSLSDILLQNVSIMDLKEYVVMLRGRDKLATHPFKPTVHKPVTNTTIHTYSVDLRTFFNFLYREEYMANDLMKKFTLIKREKKLVVPVFASDVDVIDKLFNLHTVSGLRNYCIIHLMLDAGLRSGEVCNLKVSDIDFTQGHILVFDGKGNKDRIIPLPGNLKKYLHHYIVLYRVYTPGHNYLLCSLDGLGEPITQDSIKSLFARIRKRTGIDRLKPHLLRHTFATSYILGGGDMESLRIFLGHSSYDVTQTYLHLANTYSRMGSDVYKLDKVFFRSYYPIDK